MDSQLNDKRTIHGKHECLQFCRALLIQVKNELDFLIQNRNKGISNFAKVIGNSE